LQTVQGIPAGIGEKRTVNRNRPFILEIQNARVKRGDFCLLDSISLRIREGEHTAILGPNGSGKTSLLKLISRDFYPMYSGDTVVRLFGKTAWDLFEIRKQIGVVSDSLKGFYNTGCTGEEAILSGFFGSVGLFSVHEVTEEMRRKAGEVMAFLEITNLSGKKLAHMSSGEVSRFLVGRAIIHDPKALILDEPTSHLDIKSAHTFLSYIEKLAEAGTTIIMVTHHVHDIIPPIGRIVMLKEGRVFMDGPKEQLLTDERVSSLFNFPVGIKKDGLSYYFR